MEAGAGSDLCWLGFSGRNQQKQQHQHKSMKNQQKYNRIHRQDKRYQGDAHTGAWVTQLPSSTRLLKTSENYDASPGSSVEVHYQRCLLVAILAYAFLVIKRIDLLECALKSVDLQSGSKCILGMWESAPSSPKDTLQQCGSTFRARQSHHQDS